MGWRMDRTYVLKFEGAMEGAEVKIRATSVGTVLALRGASDPAVVAGLLSEYLESWNFDDEKGEPLGTSPEDILGGVEQPVLQHIAQEWYKAATGVTAPLDFEPLTEAAIPME